MTAMRMMRMGFIINDRIEHTIYAKVENVPPIRHGVYVPFMCEIREVLFSAILETPEAEREFMTGIFRPAGLGVDGYLVWPCEKGGSCEYDLIHDPAMDQCIKCGDPYERK